MHLPCRLAFVGSAETVSPWLLRAIGQSDAQFIALCEDDAARAERTAADYHVRWPYSDLHTLLTEAQPDGVILAVPPSQRDDILRRCLTAGASVLVLGLPQAPARRVMSRGMVWGASAIRFSPAGSLVRRLIDSGKIGELVGLSVSLSRSRAAKSIEESGSPVSPDTAFEAIDWMQQLVGPFSEVFARGHPDGSIAATLVGAGGIPVALSLHEHGTPERSGLSMELRGADGTLLTLDREMRLWCGSGTRTLASYSPALGVSDPSLEFGFAGLIREFVRRMAESRAERDEHTLSSIRAAHALMTAIARAGPVRPEPRPEPSRVARASGP